MSRSTRSRARLRAGTLSAVLCLLAVGPVDVSGFGPAAAAAREPAATTAGLADPGARTVSAARTTETVSAVRRTRTPSALTMTVTGMTPAVPAAVDAASPLRITLTLRNNTSTALQDVQILARRGSPVAAQDELDATAGSPVSADTGLVVDPTHPVTVDVPAHDTVQAVFATTTGIASGAGLCLCADSVYPVSLGAYASDGGTLLGSARTYVSSIFGPVSKLSVSWVWPLLEPPHRVASETVFTDDSLTGSVLGGRLDRALAAVEDVEQQDPSFPLTLVVDPDLLDELEVMSTGNYTVRVGSQSPVPGTGQAAARQWLARFAQVLRTDPKLSVQLTPLGDPDVQSLSHHDLSWRTVLPAAIQARVSRALGGALSASTVAWPASGAISSDTLDNLSDDGVGALLLDSSAVTPSSANGVPASLAKLRSNGHSVAAALLAPQVETAVTAALDGDGVTTADRLPNLLANLALRVDTSPKAASAAVLAPSRYVDAEPERAAQVMLATSLNTFTQPASLAAAFTGPASADHRSTLHSTSADRSSLPGTILARARSVSQSLGSVGALLHPDPAARSLLGSLSPGLQRAESSAWRPDSGIADGPARGTSIAGRMSALISQLLGGVDIVRPSTPSGSYTLASSHSPLPITIENRLPYAVRVNLVLSAVGNVPGFSAAPESRVVQSTSKLTIPVDTQVQRTGRIQIEAVLSTTNIDPQVLGARIRLYVRSTVIGAIGSVITGVAAGVLVLALAVRYVRRIRRLRSQRRARAESSRTPRRPAEPSAVGAGGSSS